MNSKLQEEYLLLDSQNTALGSAVLESAPGEDQVCVRMTEENAQKAQRHMILALARSGNHPFLGHYRYSRRSGSTISMEKLVFSDRKLRELLWVPVKFTSFLYPINHEWKGRIPIRFVDLGAGVAAFYGQEGLQVGQSMQIVLPFTPQPLVVKCKIIDQKKIDDKRALYAAEFVYLCDDEDTAVTEAVFALQKKLRQGGVGLRK